MAHAHLPQLGERSVQQTGMVGITTGQSERTALGLHREVRGLQDLRDGDLAGGPRQAKAAAVASLGIHESFDHQPAHDLGKIVGGNTGLFSQISIHHGTVGRQRSQARHCPQGVFDGL
jgi:hypothetical protein